MNAKKEIHDSEHDSPENLEICPYLKWRNDETIRYGFSHVSNFCHKPKKAQPIRLSYQKPFCLTEKYTECPVFQQESVKQLPPDIRGKNIFKKGVLRNILLLMIIVFLVLGVITVLILISTSRLPPIGLEDIRFGQGVVLEDTSTLSPSPPQLEKIVPSGSSWNDESSGKTLIPSMPNLTPLSIPTQNPSNNSATISNSGIPVTRFTVMGNNRISPPELNQAITFGHIVDSTFILDTIYNQNEDYSRVIFSDLSGKNLYSKAAAQTTLRVVYGYGLMYLLIP